MQSVTLDGVQGGLVRRTPSPELLHGGSNPSQLEAAGRGWSGSAQARKHSTVYFRASCVKTLFSTSTTPSLATGPPPALEGRH